MYQPALQRRQIRALYVLKTLDGRPMTFHARRAVDMYMKRYPEVKDAIRDLETKERTEQKS